MLGVRGSCLFGYNMKIRTNNPSWSLPFFLPTVSPNLPWLLLYQFAEALFTEGTDPKEGMERCPNQLKKQTQKTTYWSCFTGWSDKNTKTKNHKRHLCCPKRHAAPLQESACFSRWWVQPCLLLSICSCSVFLLVDLGNCTCAFSRGKKNVPAVIVCGRDQESLHRKCRSAGAKQGCCPLQQLVEASLFLFYIFETCTSHASPLDAYKPTNKRWGVQVVWHMFCQTQATFLHTLDFLLTSVPRKFYSTLTLLRH